MNGASLWLDARTAPGINRVARAAAPPIRLERSFMWSPSTSSGGLLQSLESLECLVDARVVGLRRDHGEHGRVVHLPDRVRKAEVLVHVLERELRVLVARVLAH